MKIGKSEQLPEEFCFQKNIRNLRSMRLCADEYRLSLIIVFIILFFGAYFLYQVQYKTGIDLIPLFPIDDSGFE